MSDGPGLHLLHHAGADLANNNPDSLVKENTEQSWEFFMEHGSIDRLNQPKLRFVLKHKL